MTKFAMHIWIHSHYQTHEPLELDIFEFTGEHIPADLIHYLFSDEGKVNELETFDGFATEQVYLVIMSASYMEGDPEFGGPGWWELRCEGNLLLPMLEGLEEIEG